MSKSILPCPFCGEENDIGVEPYPDSFGFYVVCSAYANDGLQYRGCGSRSGYAETMSQAVAQWNRRASLSLHAEPKA